MKYCTNCVAQLPDGAKFCTSCGSPIATAPDPVRATTTPQGGIVIDAPPGSTVSISDGPQAPSSMEAPAQSGEFTMISWDEPGSQAAQQPQQPQQPPRPQQPAYQRPQRPSYQQPQQPQQPYRQQPQYPQQQYPQQPYQQQPYPQQPYQQPYPQAPAPAPPKKNKRGVLVWILIILGGLAFLAMKLGW